MENNGNYIKLFRKFLEWEWYSSTNERSVFVHMLLKANWKAKRYRGVLVERGQIMISLKDLSNELGLSVQNVRTGVKNLHLTNELTSYQHANCTVYTVVRYDYYQSTNTPFNTSTNTPLTNDQHTANTPLTNNQHTEEEREEYKEGKEREETKEENNKIDFEIFWNDYEKRKGSKTKVKSKWNKLSLKTQLKILKHIEIYKSNTPDLQFRKNPETYLNSKIWENEGEWELIENTTNSDQEYKDFQRRRELAREQILATIENKVS